MVVSKMPINVIPITASASVPQYKPSVPAVKPDDPEMMNFIALDDIQLSHDELNRQKLALKRREFLKTDLTWKQVLLERDDKRRFDGNSSMLIGIAKTLGYDYVCHKGKVYEIVKATKHDPTGGPLTQNVDYWDWVDTGLLEDEINEIL